MWRCRSAGVVGDRRANRADHVVLDHVASDADAVGDRRLAGGPVGDDADTVDAEQHGTAVGVGAQRLVQRQQCGHQRVGVGLVVLLGGERIEQVHENCPAIDIHGINSYGGALSIAKRLQEGGATKPYVLTEFGPVGPWEMPTTEWGAPYEQTSTAKADFYRQSYQQAILDNPSNALGSYAFLWGYKMEGTSTWFGMLLEDGAKLGVVDGVRPQRPRGGA